MSTPKPTSALCPGGIGKPGPSGISGESGSDPSALQSAPEPSVLQGPESEELATVVGASPTTPILPTDCLRWYALNAQCERSGNVWLRDDLRKWDGPPPLYVAAENHAGHRYVSGRYGRQERRAAWCLSQLVGRDMPPVNWLPSADSTITLGPTQEIALGVSCYQPVSVITGGPGTGKTTIARLLANAHSRIIGLSPTGKGADRLSVSIGVQCYTIHRACRLVQNEILDLSKYDLVLCDEAGMLDSETLEMLCSQLHNSKTWARIVFLGDPGQLPSVGPGRVLEELMSILPTTRLDIVYRYSDSDIGLACESARAGRLHDGLTATYSLTEGGFSTTADEYRRLVGLYGTQETRLITLHRSYSDAFNISMISQYPTRPPIVCYKNNYQHNVFNGQCGYADYVGGKSIVFGNKRLCAKDVKWSYGYASTCHRAQGGQWDGVIVWVPSARYISREWLLTACSRAVKSLSIVVRDAAYTERCLAASKPASRRVSLLSAFLSGEARWVQ